jgi:Uma2 family endonuclease
MATVETLLTAEEYGLLPDNGQPTELVRGRIVPLNMPYPRHGEICAKTVHLLSLHLDAHPRGRVVSNDSGIITEREPDTVRGADVAYYSFDRIPQGPLPRKYLNVSPELIFEVRSPGDSWPEIHVKVGEHHNAGVLLVCVLDQQTETATVYTKDGPPLVLKRDQELSFPGLLPGWSVKVSRFFE